MGLVVLAAAVLLALNIVDVAAEWRAPASSVTPEPPGVLSTSQGLNTPIPKSSRMVQHYHSSVLQYLRQSLLAQSAVQPDTSPLPELLRLTDQLQSLDWRSQAQQQPALQLLQELASLLRSWPSLGGTQWPLVRRLLVGSLMQDVHRRSGALHQAVQQASGALVLQLFKHHIHDAAAKGIVHFMHVSKSAGTTMCVTAAANKCRTQSFNYSTHNCLVSEFGDCPAWTTLPTVDSAYGHKVPSPWYRSPASLARQEQSCAARKRWLQRNSWNFFASELYLSCVGARRQQTPSSKQQGGNTGRSTAATKARAEGEGAEGGDAAGSLSGGGALGAGQPPGSTRQLGAQGSIASTRASQGNDASHARSAAGAPIAAGPSSSSCLCSDFVNAITLRDPLHRTLSHLGHLASFHVHNGSPAWRNTSFLMEASHMTVNNYYVRSLLGRAVYWLPAGQITHQHAEQALLVLLQFDSIMVLEDRAGTDLVLTRGLGWKAGMNGIKQRNTHDSSTKINITSTHVTQLLQQNTEDVWLYYHGWALHSIDVMFLQQVQQLQGLGGTQSIDPSCGYISRSP